MSKNTNANTEIPSELKKYINQYFKEYHIKDCLVVLPVQATETDIPLLDVNDPTTGYVIRHISTMPNTECLCINLELTKPSTTQDSNNINNTNATIGNRLDTGKLHELISEYMSRLATLVEQSTSREPKPAAIWKHRNFLSSISHQVKTPLSAIFSGTKLIKHYTNNEYIDRICEYMNQSCVELTRYMNDIIDFYYLKQGVLVLDDNRVALGDTIDYVYENYKLQMQDADIEFMTQIDPGIPGMIHCDELRLTQILMNLIDNAVKFTSHPSNDDEMHVVSVVPAAKKVVAVHAFVSADKGRHQIIIQVADTGYGKIDLDHQETYFQPFNQTTRNWLSAPDGIGLGLCLSRDFARLMGGELKFINPAKSIIKCMHFQTCIELVLPITETTIKVSHSKNSAHKRTPVVSIRTAPEINTVDTDVTPILRPPLVGLEFNVKGTPTAKQHSIKNKELVLIDDNLTNIELLALILEQLGHQNINIKSFTNSLDGQKYIIAHAAQISHAIIDIRMPRKNGLDLVSELAPTYHNIHFMLLTALNHDDIRARFSQIRDGNPSTRISLLFKPIDCAELQKLLCVTNIKNKERKMSCV
jgi:signal transduction histidine kinase/CheY-like chemotaxis protein